MSDRIPIAVVCYHQLLQAKILSYWTQEVFASFSRTKTLTFGTLSNATWYRRSHQVISTQKLESKNFMLLKTVEKIT